MEGKEKGAAYLNHLRPCQKEGDIAAVLGKQSNGLLSTVDVNPIDLKRQIKCAFKD